MARKYTLEFKEEAVKLVTEQGYSKAKAARTLGIDKKNIARWINKLTNKKTTRNGGTSEETTIRQLRKEIERLRMEREILKKAAAFFANEKN